LRQSAIRRRGRGMHRKQPASPFLGRIPLAIEIANIVMPGTPTAVGGPQAEVFNAVARHWLTGWRIPSAHPSCGSARQGRLVGAAPWRFGG
jgi:hypothetical protein